MASGNTATDASSSQTWTASSANLEDELFGECTIIVKPEWQTKLDQIYGKEKALAEVIHTLEGCANVKVEKYSDFISAIKGPLRAVNVARGELLDLVNKFKNRGYVMAAASNAGVSTSPYPSAALVQSVGSQCISETVTRPLHVRSTTTDSSVTLSERERSSRADDGKSSEASATSVDAPQAPQRKNRIPSSGRRSRPVSGSTVEDTESSCESTSSVVRSSTIDMELHIWAYLSAKHALHEFDSRGVKYVMHEQHDKLEITAPSWELLEEVIDFLAELCRNLLNIDNIVSWPVWLNADHNTSQHKQELLNHSVLLYRTNCNALNASGANHQSSPSKAMYLVIGPQQEMSYALQVLIDLIVCISLPISGKSHAVVLSSTVQSQGVWKSGHNLRNQNMDTQSCQPYHFRTSCGLNIHICQGDLTREIAQAIVSPNNVLMKLDGGASRCIADAAGQKFKEECQKYIKSNGPLTVSKPIHTASGNLPKPIKHVIHVVGPTYVHTGSNEKSYRLLMESFYNCLDYANGQLKVSSVAIPAISSGNNSMSKQVVASRAFEALMRFNDRCLQDSSLSLKEVRFVNIDVETTTEFINVFRCLVDSTGILTIKRVAFSMKSAGRPTDAVADIQSSRTLSRGRPLDGSMAQSPSKNGSGSVDRDTGSASSPVDDLSRSGAGNDGKGTIVTRADHTGVRGGNHDGGAAYLSVHLSGASTGNDGKGTAMTRADHTGVRGGNHDGGAAYLSVHLSGASTGVDGNRIPSTSDDRSAISGNKGSNASANSADIFGGNDGRATNGSTYLSAVTGGIDGNKSTSTSADRFSVSGSNAAQNAGSGTSVFPVEGSSRTTQSSLGVSPGLPSAVSSVQSSNDGTSPLPGATVSDLSNTHVSQVSWSSVVKSTSNGMTNDTTTNNQGSRQQANAPLPGVDSAAVLPSKPHGPLERFSCYSTDTELKASDVTVITLKDEDKKSLYRCVAVHWHSDLQEAKRYYHSNWPEDLELKKLEDSTSENLRSCVVSLLDSTFKQNCSQSLDIHLNYSLSSVKCYPRKTVKERIHSLREPWSSYTDPLELLAVAYFTQTPVHLYRAESSSSYKLHARYPPSAYPSHRPILLLGDFNFTRFKLIIPKKSTRSDSVGGVESTSRNHGWDEMLARRASYEDGRLKFEHLIDPSVVLPSDERDKVPSSDRPEVSHASSLQNIARGLVTSVTSFFTGTSGEHVLSKSSVKVIPVSKSLISVYRCVAAHGCEDLQRAKRRYGGALTDGQMYNLEERFVENMKKEVLSLLRSSYPLLEALNVQLNYSLCDPSCIQYIPLQKRIDELSSSYIRGADPLEFLALAYLTKTQVHLYQSHGDQYKLLTKYPLHAYSSRQPLTLLCVDDYYFEALLVGNAQRRWSFDSPSGMFTSYAESASDEDKAITFEQLINPCLRLPIGYNGEKHDASGGETQDEGERRRLNVAAKVEPPGGSDDSLDLRTFEVVDPVPQGEDCVICMDKIVASRIKKLPCGHVFCADCIDECFKKHQPRCPSCGRVFGALRGNQPADGLFDERTVHTSLPGYEGCGTIEITYSFRNGTQTEDHPNPGHPYKGIRRTAYLPDNPEGREVCGLLKRAFDAGLVFTIDRSVTTGKENCVVWNNIHHKTMISGTYGYPDSTYLTRVKDELAAKGIVPLSATKL